MFHSITERSLISKSLLQFLSQSALLAEITVSLMMSTMAIIIDVQSKNKNILPMRLQGEGRKHQFAGSRRQMGTICEPGWTLDWAD